MKTKRSILTFVIFVAVFMFLFKMNISAELSSSKKHGVIGNENLIFLDTVNSFSKGQRLPDYFIKKYVGSNPEIPVHGYKKWYIEDEIIKKDQGIIFIFIKIEAPEGIGKSIQSFTELGDKIDTLLIYSGSGICDAGVVSTDHSYDVKNDETIEVRKISTICYQDTLVELDVNFYSLSENGTFIPKENFFNSESRKYPEASEYKISEKLLRKFSKDELRLLRNEIFAAHGQIFKTKYFKNYFTSQKWYQAKYNNVSSKLNSIEKYNIELILKFENARNIYN